MYPNLHRYPATMLPQIGIELLKDFKVKKTNLLDPYCGSGSSFSAGLDYGIQKFYGFDLNPLTIMISRAKLSFIDEFLLEKEKEKLLNKLFFGICYLEVDSYIAKEAKNIKNADFWFSDENLRKLTYIFGLLQKIENKSIKNLFFLTFSETLREVSFTRNGEFKLFRMKNYEDFQPNVFNIFSNKLVNVTDNYLKYYQPKLKNVFFRVLNTCALKNDIHFDCILTSPLYGDSKTTCAYGQFSTFTNEWLGMKEARKLDSFLMGGKKSKELYSRYSIKECILEVCQKDKKRALEISSFYFDLESDINHLAQYANHGAKVFFVVGNRQVKGIELQTDKFIAETFMQNGLRHLETIERAISNKTMPTRNSPTNKMGVQSSTMNKEYIVVCEKSV